MSKIKIAELFYSLQGEGKYTGVPSVFLRTFGCNFTCSGFGMPSGTCSTEADSLAKRVHEFKFYHELPLVSTGCDSYASWHPAFKDLSPTYDTDIVAESIVDLLPNKRWRSEHLVITGGEPLLGWQRSYPDLLDHVRMSGLENLTFETNGTQKLSKDFTEYLSKWSCYDRERITFSVSPKLSISGEEWENAIKPDVVSEYQIVGEVYLKFVVANAHDVEEADRAIDEYRKAGFNGHVYLMPCGGVESVYNLNTREVAELAMKRGYRYSPRLQVDIWRNAWGT